MYRERIVSDLLKPFLPSRLAVGTGFIITHQNKQSTQCDLIIYDKENTPVIENGDQRFFGRMRHWCCRSKKYFINIRGR